MQMYTFSDPKSGNLTGNFTDLLSSTATLGNMLSPSQLPLYAQVPVPHTSLQHRFRSKAYVRSNHSRYFSGPEL